MKINVAKIANEVMGKIKLLFWSFLIEVYMDGICASVSKFTCYGIITINIRGLNTLLRENTILFFLLFFKLLWNGFKFVFFYWFLKKVIIFVYLIVLGKVVIGLLEISKGKLQRLFFNWKFEWNCSFWLLFA